MVLSVIYIAAVIVLVPVIVVAAEPHRVLYSVLAAVLWPVLAVGVMQFGAVVLAQRVLTSKPRPVRVPAQIRIPAGPPADHMSFI